MRGGGRDASSTLWWSSGRGRPQAPALWGPLAGSWPWVSPVWATPGCPEAFLSSLPPRPVCAHGHTQMSACAQTRVTPAAAHPPCPSADPTPGKVHSGEGGLGAVSDVLAYLSPLHP